MSDQKAAATNAPSADRPAEPASGADGDRVKSYALDPDNADRLREMSETLVGERFPLRS